MDELPEETIEAAEEEPAAHDHEDVGEDGLAEHLQRVHRLDAPGHLSSSTLDGLHDRLHDESDAAEDPGEG